MLTSSDAGAGAGPMRAGQRLLRLCASEGWCAQRGMRELRPGQRQMRVGHVEIRLGHVAVSLCFRE